MSAAHFCSSGNFLLLKIKQGTDNPSLLKDARRYDICYFFPQSGSFQKSSLQHFYSIFHPLAKPSLNSVFQQANIQENANKHLR